MITADLDGCVRLLSAILFPSSLFFTTKKELQSSHCSPGWPSGKVRAAGRGYSQRSDATSAQSAGAKQAENENRLHRSCCSLRWFSLGAEVGHLLSPAHRSPVQSCKAARQSMDSRKKVGYNYSQSNIWYRMCVEM